MWMMVLGAPVAVLHVRMIVCAGTYIGVFFFWMKLLVDVDVVEIVYVF